MAEYRLLIRDRDLVPRAEITGVYKDLDVILRWNDGGTWVLTIDANAPGAEYIEMQDGDEGSPGLIVLRDGEVLFSGPWLHVEREERADGDVLHVDGIDDTARLSGRLAHPAPATLDYSTAGHDVRTGKAETLLHQYTTVNAGPSAVVQRRMRNLAMGTDGGRGTTMTKRARNPVLLDLLREIAAQDNLRFQIRQATSDTAQITFETSQPGDKTNLVIFARELGNLAGAKRTEAAATGNFIVAGGGNEMTERVFVTRGDPASITRYGLWEQFVDQRQTTSTDELSVAVAEALEAGKGGIDLEVTPTDVEPLVFGEDYNLGDRVTAVVKAERVLGYVTEVRVSLNAEGVRVVPIVTTVAITPRQRSAGAQTARRLNHLEALAETWTIGMGTFWYRAVSDIPAGWQLADGTNGTPDMRDKFVVGAGGAYTLFQTGGADAVDLRHTHPGAQHTHSHDHPGAPHTHSHTHDGAPHSHEHDHTSAAHAHSHVHAGAAHTHSHAHTSAAHSHSHDHTSAAHGHSHSHTSAAHSHSHDHTSPAHGHSHSHTSAAHAHSHAHQAPNHTHGHSHTLGHTHSHSHTGPSHTHATDINHNHGSENTTTNNASISFSNGTGAAVTAADHPHIHAVDLASLGTSAVTSDAAGTGATGADASGPSVADTGTALSAGSGGGDSTTTDATSTTPGATGTDGTSTTPGNTGTSAVSTTPGATGTDGTSTTPGNTGTSAVSTTPADTGTNAAAASAANTGGDATPTTPDNTGSDNTAAAFSGATGVNAAAATFSGDTGPDATAATYGSESGPANPVLTPVENRPPFKAVYLIVRTST